VEQFARQVLVKLQVGAAAVLVEPGLEARAVRDEPRPVRRSGVHRLGENRIAQRGLDLADQGVELEAGDRADLREGGSLDFGERGNLPLIDQEDQIVLFGAQASKVALQ
jgi:hypothetical protein